MLYFSSHHRAAGDLGQGHHTKVGILRMALLLGALGMLFSLTACVPLEEAPSIVSVNLSPSTIQVNRYNGTMNVSIIIDGFEGEIVEADVFIQIPPDSPRDAQKDSITADTGAVILHGVAKTWFQGLEPGLYNIGASVTSNAGETIEQLDLATVTITE